MNPTFRLAALIAASLGLIISLYMALSKDGDDTAAPAEPALTATAPPVEGVLELEVVVGADGVDEVERFEVRLDRKLRLVVRSELADHVHLHGYDLMEDVGPNAPATIEFTATAPGRFEIELEERGLEIAELEVRP